MFIISNIIKYMYLCHMIRTKAFIVENIKSLELCVVKMIKEMIISNPLAAIL